MPGLHVTVPKRQQVVRAHHSYGYANHHKLPHEVILIELMWMANPIKQLVSTTTPSTWAVTLELKKLETKKAKLDNAIIIDESTNWGSIAEAVKAMAVLLAGSDFLTINNFLNMRPLPFLIPNTSIAQSKLDQTTLTSCRLFKHEGVKAE